MIIKNFDITDLTVWAINHKLRRTQNSLTMFDMHKIINHLSAVDEVKCQLTTITDGCTGSTVWQLNEVIPHHVTQETHHTGTVWG